MKQRPHDKRLLAVLGYTVNPQPDGTHCPYVALPTDYFPSPNHERHQAAQAWLNKLRGVLDMPAKQWEAQV